MIAPDAWLQGATGIVSGYIAPADPGDYDTGLTPDEDPEGKEFFLELNPTVTTFTLPNLSRVAEISLGLPNTRHIYWKDQNTDRDLRSLQTVQLAAFTGDSIMANIRMQLDAEGEGGGIGVG